MPAIGDVLVLDVSQVLAGPLAATMLGDMGCDVIKVEPLAGDATRYTFGTPAPWGETPGYMSVNRNKRSIALDLKSDRGRAVFLQLAARADVVIQSSRPGVAERLGISYEELKKNNERLVFCSISGFGNSGPYAKRGGYDMMAQALSGIMSVTGEAGGPPCRCGVPIADIGTGLFAAVGILGALMSREETGKGCLLEANLYDSALAYAVWDSAQFWASGAVPRAMGSAHQMNAPYQAYRCKDGHVTIGANNAKLWERLCDGLGHPEWTVDPRFESAPSRVIHMDELTETIEASLADRTRSEVEELLEAFDVPVGAVRTYEEVFQGEEQKADGMVLEAAYRAHTAKFLGSPLKRDHSRLPMRARPPQLGEHTEEILRWLGLDDAAVSELQALGVVNS